jgi:hypothetical protein
MSINIIKLCFFKATSNEKTIFDQASTANAEESAGLLSKLFFAYVQPILSRGWREPLTTVRNDLILKNK